MKEKEIKQEKIEIEEYVEKLEKQLETGFIGVITAVKSTTNTLFFKGAGAFAEREGISVKVNLRGDNTEFYQWFSKPSLRGYEQSNIYAFKQKYHSIPKTSIEVECFIDENGFFKIKL